MYKDRSGARCWKNHLVAYKPQNHTTSSRFSISLFHLIFFQQSSTFLLSNHGCHHSTRRRWCHGRRRPGPPFNAHILNSRLRHCTLQETAHRGWHGPEAAHWRCPEEANCLPIQAQSQLHDCQGRCCRCCCKFSSLSLEVSVTDKPHRTSTLSPSSMASESPTPSASWSPAASIHLTCTRVRPNFSRSSQRPSSASATS